MRAVLCVLIVTPTPLRDWRDTSRETRDLAVLRKPEKPRPDRVERLDTYVRIYADFGTVGTFAKVLGDFIVVGHFESSLIDDKSRVSLRGGINSRDGRKSSDLEKLDFRASLKCSRRRSSDHHRRPSERSRAEVIVLRYYAR